MSAIKTPEELRAIKKDIAEGYLYGFCMSGEDSEEFADFREKHHLNEDGREALTDVEVDFLLQLQQRANDKANNVKPDNKAKTKPTKTVELNTDDVVLTVFTSTQHQSKKFYLVNGEIEKEFSSPMSRGTAQRLKISVKTFLRDFSKRLAAVTSEQAYGYGDYPDDLPDKINIVTKAKVQPGKNIARSKDFFSDVAGLAVVMLDYDINAVYGFIMTQSSHLKALVKVHQEIGEAMCVVRGSCSAGVHKVDEQPKTDSGFHTWCVAKDGRDLPRYGSVLFDRLWLAGFGFIDLNAGGSMLERTIIDGAVFSPERLDFVGQPLIEGDGLAYTEPKITSKQGGVLDTSTLKDLTAEEQVTVKKLKDEAKVAIQPEAEAKRTEWAKKRIAEMVENGTTEAEARATVEGVLSSKGADLYGAFILEFAGSLGRVSIGDVLSEPAKYDYKTLADPVEGAKEGTTKAMFYWNGGKKPFINSHAHGGCKYFLHREVPAHGAGKKEEARGDAVDHDLIDQVLEAMKTDGLAWCADDFLKEMATLKESYLGKFQGVIKELKTYPDFIKKDFDEKLKAIFAARKAAAKGAGMSAQSKSSTSSTPAFGSANLSDAIGWSGFPHTAQSGKPKATIENLEHLLNAYGITCYYDEILKKQFVVFPEEVECRNDMSENGKIQHLRSLLALNDVPKEDIAHRDKLLLTWLIQCVAAADGAERSPIEHKLAKYELVLTLQGFQGTMKTSWFLALLPENYAAYIIDGVHLNIDDKDTIKKAVSAWITELGELDSTFKKSDVAQFKAFMSNRTDTIRLPYDRVASAFQRRTSFCGSVNDPRFITDTTGARRLGILKVININYHHKIDMQQLWAEVWQLYIAGAQWWPDAEMQAMCAARDGQHSQVCHVEDSMRSVFDLSLKPKKGGLLYAKHILEACGLPNIRLNVNLCIGLLEKLGFIRCSNRFVTNGFRLARLENQADVLEAEELAKHKKG